MSKFPSALQSRFSEFISPSPLKTNDEGGEVSRSNGIILPIEISASCSSSGNDGEPVLCPSMSAWLKASLLVAIVSVAASVAIASHVKHWLWKWGHVLLSHFCGLVVARFVVAFCVLRIPTSSMHLTFQYFVYSAVATAWLFVVILLISFPANKFLVDDELDVLFFKYLQTLMYMFIIGNTSFHIFQSIYLHWMFRSWMQETATHLFALDALMGPPMRKKKRKELEADPVSSALRKFERMSAAAFCTDSLLVVNFPGVKGFLTEVADRLQLILPPFCINSRLRDAADMKLWANIDGFRESKFQADSQMKILEEARQAFKRVDLLRKRFINRKDILRYLIEDDVNMIYSLIAKNVGAGIDELAFQEWVVEAYRLRKSLVHAITDMKIMMSDLYKVSMTLITVVFLMFSLGKVATLTAVLFWFLPEVSRLQDKSKNTGKGIFDSVLFLFVAHPFDVGDCCEIDGIQMIVEEMNIMDTVFLRFDNKKIRYRNSELMAKPISNYSRNSDIGEKIEFSIDVSTTDKIVNDLKIHIKEYLEAKEKYWQTNHSILVEGIEKGRLKMDLNVLHKMNYHNFPEMKKHRIELLFALKGFFDHLHIKNYAFPSSHTSEFHGACDYDLSNLSCNTPLDSSSDDISAKPISAHNENSDIAEKLEDSTPSETVNKMRTHVEIHLKNDPGNWQLNRSLPMKESGVLPESTSRNYPKTSKSRSAWKKIIVSLGIINYLLRRFPAKGAMDSHLKQTRMSRTLSTPRQTTTATHLSRIKPHLVRSRSF